MITQRKLIEDQLRYLRMPDYMGDPYGEMKEIENQIFELKERFNFLFDSLQSRKNNIEELEEMLKELDK